MLEQMWSLIMEQELLSVLIQGIMLSQCNAQKVSDIKGQKKKNSDKNIQQ